MRLMVRAFYNYPRRCLGRRAVLLVSLIFVVMGRASAADSDLAYTFSTFAGRANIGSDDGAGGSAKFFNPRGVTTDGAGNLYVADSGNSTIRKITPAGVVSTIAGFAGSQGSVDGINGAARFRTPDQITIDKSGSLYVTDSGYSLRRITPAGTNWVVSSVLDGLVFGQNEFRGIAVDPAGNLFVAQVFQPSRQPNQFPPPFCYILKVTRSAADWEVTRIAGDVAGSADGVGTNALFVGPSAVALDPGGNIYVTDYGANGSAIRRISQVGTNWVTSTIATGLLGEPQGIAVDRTGALFVSDARLNGIQKLIPSGGSWSVVSFVGGSSNCGNANGTGTNAAFCSPVGLTVDNLGNLVVADAGNHMIRKITSAGLVTTPAGGGDDSGARDGTGDDARFNQPYGVAVSGDDKLFVADTLNHTIRQITSAGVVNTLAGLAGSLGSDDGVGTYARFNKPRALAVDGSGIVYVLDAGNFTIRKITPAGLVSTLAGNASLKNQFGDRTGGFADGNGTGAQFSFSLSGGLAVDAVGNVYVADSGNHCIRKITPGGVVTTIAGSAANSGSSDGTNGGAQFYFPSAIAVGSEGVLYVMDYAAIRKVTPVGPNWVVTTLAGGRNAGTRDGAGSVAGFGLPGGIAVDNRDNLYLADTLNNTIRKVSLVGSEWVATTIAGLAGTLGTAGINPTRGVSHHGSDDGVGSVARFNSPRGVAVSPSGVLYVADTANNTIRRGEFTAYASAKLTDFVAPPMDGQLTVLLFPPEAKGQWRFPWEFGWHNSGSIVSNLVAGNYPVEFRPIPGYLALPVQPVQVTGGLTTLTNEYFPASSTGESSSATGTLTVFLGPTPPAGSGWRFLGDSGAFFSTGFSTNLSPGIYLIEFSAVAGRIKPSSQTVRIRAGQPSFLFVNYLLAASPPTEVYLPFPVPNHLLNDEAKPFRFVGQLQSDTGYGSGVAIQTNVVLTTAHLVFDDQTLSFVSRAHWFFRRDAGLSEPLPQAARAYYILSGYAAQRTNDLASGYFPEQSSPPSRNLDVAALYFGQPVAGGGHAGYLPSDAVPNIWLAGNTLKMLVGYPVDGSLFGDPNLLPGRMYQIEPQPYPLTLAPDPVPGQTQIYVAPWFLSYPGASGGPLCVELNGYYYPSAVYLGTLFSGDRPYASVVRAIDSSVVDLINRTATLGDRGTNNTGGGVIILPNSVGTGGLQNLTVNLIAPAAAKATWFLRGGYPGKTNLASGRTIFLPTESEVIVGFVAAPGFNAVNDVTVKMSTGRTIIATFVAQLNLALNRNGLLTVSGPAGSRIRVEFAPELSSSILWQAAGTNVLTGETPTVISTVNLGKTSGYYRAIVLP